MNPATGNVVLLDLGGVVIDFSGPAELVDLVDVPLDAAEIKRRWGVDPCVAAFERGDSDADEFARCFVARWRLDLAPAQFLARFTGWSRCWLPGALPLLDALRRRHRLACLSNSNPLHWERNLAVHRIAERFDLCLASHELRALKPEPQIFAAALARLGVAAGAVAFFDDSPANVAGARACGIDAHLVDGVADLHERLTALGLL